MKMVSKRICTLLMAIVLMASFAHIASAEIVITDYEGNKHLVFGGHMVDRFGDVHSLSNVNGFIDFDLNENRQLWLGIYDAIADWDWHLSYISNYMSAREGYDTDQYGFGMSCNAVYRSEADIYFNYVDDYLTIGGVHDSNVLGITIPRNMAGEPIVQDVAINHANWRTATITISQKKIDNYALDHTEAETERFIKKIVNHEIGHALGLAHDSGDNGILMYGNSNHSLCNGYTYEGIDNRTATVPTLHDLLGVYYLYN